MQPSAPDQLSLVRNSFNAVAIQFEQRYENEISRRLRQILYREVEDLIPSGSAVLDISCGTGIDARKLSDMGYRVAASDVSDGMVEEARRLSSGRHRDSISYTVVSMEQSSDAFKEPFDLVFTSFGALNCTGNLVEVSRSVTRLVKPGGYFLAIAMPPVCLWELLAGLVRLHPSFAFRRMRGSSAATGFEGLSFVVTYHRLGALRKMLEPSFAFRSARGMSVLSPPPHATGFVRSFPRLSEFLSTLDERLSTLPLYRAIGDHYLAVWQRRDLAG